MRRHGICHFWGTGAGLGRHPDTLMAHKFSIIVFGLLILSKKHYRWTLRNEVPVRL